MSRLRIGIDYRPALLGRSGIGRYVRELVAALPAVMGDAELALFGAFWKDIGVRELPDSLENAQLYSPRIPGRLFKGLGKLGLAQVETLTGPVDLFHCTDYVELPVRTPRRLVTIHDVGFLREPSWYEPSSRARIEQATRRLVADAQGIVAVSETTREDLIERLGVSEDKVTVTPLGVTPSFFDLPHVPTGPPQVLVVGTLEPRKNHGRLFQAFESIVERHPGTKLIVVGQRGWLDDELVKDLLRLEDKGVAEWRPDLNDAALCQAMSESSVVAYPSLWEGFGLPVLEGMAAGRAVLTSNLGVLKEVTEDGALLVDPYSVDAIAEGLDHLLSDEKIRREFGAKGQERARTFTWKNCAEGTVAAWHRILEVSKP
ncbi:MAG: glycosyltransferase involved in cell wall biosynthesis [Planctomycetota bacterium]|jgi:glycosyltransferase involved in cell wall biosynthesis